MSERVLVIDDDPVMLELLKAVLTNGGLAVMEAVDGMRGLEIIQGEHPDLVLSDVMMPRMDGFELVRRVRSDPLISSTPLIILSAKGEEEDRIKGLELGANDYLTKPFSGKELVARVRSTIRYRDMLRTQRAPIPEGPFARKGMEHLAQLTFETFIQGTGNRSALEASRAAAENPGTRFNPLFLYGGPGLGKTHLMCALANEVFRRNPSVKVLYLTSEVFSAQIVDAYRDRQVADLREQYLQADVMIIDDIQFLAISPSMQTVAADILSVMYDKGKQIVISSDRRPEELEALTTEISTAFALGLVVRVDQPDATLRTSILRAAALRNKWPIDPEILDYLGLRLASDLRTLNGIAKRLVAMKALSGVVITKGTVDTLIAEVTSGMEGAAPSAAEEPKDTAAMGPPGAAPGAPSPTPSPPSGDPLGDEFTAQARLTKTLTGQHEAAVALAGMQARTVVVLGTSPAVAIDTVDMLAASRERALALPEGDDWVYLVHVAEGAPSWCLLAAGRWRPTEDVPRMLAGARAPVVLVVLDSLSPRVLEARELIATLGKDCGMAVVVLVPTLADDPSPRTTEALSRSMRRLFVVPPCIPVIMSGRLTTAASRSWICKAMESPAFQGRAGRSDLAFSEATHAGIRA